MDISMVECICQEWRERYASDHDPTVVREVIYQLLELLDRHREIRDQLTYANIDAFLESCLLSLMNPETAEDTRRLSEEREYMTRLLKTDFLLENLYLQRRKTIHS